MHRVSTLLAAIAMVVASLPASPAQARPAEVAPHVVGADYAIRRAPLDMFGVENDGFDLAHSTGLGWLRVILSWSDVEPTRGTFNWATYDAPLAAARAAGYQVIAVFRQNPSW